MDAAELDAALLAACRDNDVNRVRQLVRDGADENLYTGDAVLAASSNGSIDVVHYFFTEYRNARGNPIWISRFATDAIFLAALANHHFDVVEFLYAQWPGVIAEVGTQRKEFRQLLEQSINDGDDAVFAWLIDHGIMPYRQQVRRAIQVNALAMLKRMLRVGAEHEHINVAAIKVSSSRARRVIEEWRRDVAAVAAWLQLGAIVEVDRFERQQRYTDAEATLPDDAALFFRIDGVRASDAEEEQFRAQRVSSLCTPTMVDDASRVTWTRAEYSIRQPRVYPRPDHNAKYSARVTSMRMLNLAGDPAYEADAHAIDDSFLHNINYHAALYLRGKVQGYMPSTTSRGVVFNARRWLAADDVDYVTAGDIVDELLAADSTIRSVDDVVRAFDCPLAEWVRQRALAKFPPPPRYRDQTLDRWLEKRRRLTKAQPSSVQWRWM